MKEQQLQNGFSVFSLLAALVLVGLLYAGYAAFMPLSNPDSGVQRVSRSSSKGTACSMNRRAAEKALLTWSVRHPGQTATLNELEREGISVLGCPERGRFSVSGKSVVCSIH